MSGVARCTDHVYKYYQWCIDKKPSLHHCLMYLGTLPPLLSTIHRQSSI